MAYHWTTRNIPPDLHILPVHIWRTTKELSCNVTERSICKDEGDISHLIIYVFLCHSIGKMFTMKAEIYMSLLLAPTPLCCILKKKFFQKCIGKRKQKELSLLTPYFPRKIWKLRSKSKNLQNFPLTTSRRCTTGFVSRRKRRKSCTNH